MSNQPLPNTSDPEKKDAKRINDILLGPIERPLLAWLARKMPPWINPDHLTFLGFLATVLIFVSYILTTHNKAFLWLASLGFIINWFGDSLDGTLARYRKIERPIYGFFIDHTVDALGEFLVFLGIGLSPYVDFRIACLALIGYLLLSILVYITTYVKGVFRISFLKLGPTEMRVIAILANTFVFFAGNPKVTFSFGVFTFYDVLLFIIFLLMTGAFVYLTLEQAIVLSRADVERQKNKKAKKRIFKFKKKDKEKTGANITASSDSQ